MKIQEVSGIILAGGQSSRMGRDKALLTLGGRSLAEIQADKLRSLGLDDIMLSGSGHSVPGVRTVPDEQPGQGPLGGLQACLRAARRPACLVLSVDVPLLPAELLAELIGAHTGGVTALRRGDAVEPLIAVYDSSLYETCGELLQTGRRAVRGLLERCSVRDFVFTGDELLLLNCNTPEDFERVKAQWNKSIS